MNIFRKSAISIHKQYLGEDKKKTVKSNMFNCLINDSYLLEILQSCNNRWNFPEQLPRIVDLIM